MLNKFRGGFTLVELLVVIAMLGILSAVLVMAINPLAQIQRGRDTQRKSNLASIQSALELYRHDFGNYPYNSTTPPGLYPVSMSNCTSDTFQGTINGGTVTYLQSIPCDPLGFSATSSTFNKGQYLYIPYNSSNSPTYICNNSSTPCLSYVLVACLENASDTGENTYNASQISTDFPSYVSQTLSGTSPSCSSKVYYIVQNP